LPSLLRIINQINRLASLAAGFFTAFIALVVCYAVIARYVLNRPVGWSEEVSIYFMIWAAFLGAGYTMLTDGHIGVDIFCRKLSPKAQARLNLVKYLIGIAFLVLLAVKGFQDCALSFKLGQVSLSELAMPLFLPQLALPLGAILMALQLLAKFLSQVMGVNQEDDS